MPRRDEQQKRHAARPDNAVRRHHLGRGWSANRTEPETDRCRIARNGAVDGGEKRAGIRRSERSRDVSQRREVPAAAHVALVRRRASASPARCVHQRNRAGLSLARVSLLGSARRASALEVGVVEQRAGATAARATGHRISSTESAPATCAARPATALHWRAHSCPAPQRTRRGVRVSTSAAHPIGRADRSQRCRRRQTRERGPRRRPTWRRPNARRAGKGTCAARRWRQVRRGPCRARSVRRTTRRRRLVTRYPIRHRSRSRQIACPLQPGCGHAQVPAGFSSVLVGCSSGAASASATTSAAASALRA